MDINNLSSNYSDPTATPNSGIPPESLALSGAADAGDVLRVQRLLDELPAEISLPIPKAQYLSHARVIAATHELHDACQKGDLEQVQSLLQQWRSDPSLRDPNAEDFDMALILAAKTGRPSTVRYLLNQGAVMGNTAPKLATKDGDDAITVYQAFLDHGWDINSYHNIPVLHSATKNEALTKWFLENGADPNLISKDGHTPLDFAATISTPAVVDLLISHGARIEDSNALHNTVVTIVNNEECKKMMNFLLGKGVDVNTMSFQNRPEFLARPQGNSSTALHWAVQRHGTRRGKKNMLEKVRWLLARGADRDIKNMKGKKPIECTDDQAMIDLLSSPVEPK